MNTIPAPHRRALLQAGLGLGAGHLLGACSTAPPTAPTPTPTPMPVPALQAGRHQALHWDLPGQTEPLRFWLHLPRAYRPDGPAWPLVVFLHGSGERGQDLDRVKVHGPPMQVEQGQDLPFVLVSPQLEAGARWQTPRLEALRTALVSRLHLDPRRCSATGLSLGGHGVWHWAAQAPGALSAIAPVCGFGAPELACALRATPVRAYHGAADTVVPLAAQQTLVDALRACGGTVDFTVYPGVGHDAWTPAYADPGLYPWLTGVRLPADPSARKAAA